MDVPVLPFVALRDGRRVCYAASMPLADADGPRWIRQHKVAVDKRQRGLRPVRDFLLGLLARFGRENRASGDAKRFDDRPN